MQRTHFIPLSFAVLAMIVSAPRAQPALEAAPAAPESRYTTIFLLSGHSSGDSSIDRQIQADIATVLEEKGVVVAQPEEALAVGVVHVATEAEHSRDAFYRGWGGWEWRVASTGAADRTAYYKAGSAVVDVFDARTKQLIWTGEAPNVISSKSDAAEPRKKAIEKLFRTFPVIGANQFLQPPPLTGDHSPVNDDTERIIFTEGPALLVRIDGEPRYESIGGTELERVVNTDAFIVRDEADMHYLKLANLWMESAGLTGAWSPAGVPPDGAARASDSTPRGTDGDGIAPATAATVPVVYVVTTPTELVVSTGKPEYVPVKGTSLRYFANASAVVFMEPTDRELYVRLGTGWFRSWTTNGPWERIGDAALPADLMPLHNITKAALDSALDLP